MGDRQTAQVPLLHSPTTFLPGNPEWKVISLEFHASCILHRTLFPLLHLRQLLTLLDLVSLQTLSRLPLPTTTMEVLDILN